MKRYFFLVLLIVVGATCLYAGPKGEPKDAAEMKKEIRDFKIRFIAQEIGLRDDQRARFTETYSRMMDEEDAIFSELTRLRNELNDAKNASDAQYQAISTAMTNGKARGAALEKKYDALFAQFLTPRQVYQMKEAEMKFRRKMEQMCGEKRGKRNRKTKSQ